MTQGNRAKQRYRSIAHIPQGKIPIGLTRSCADCLIQSGRVEKYIPGHSGAQLGRYCDSCSALGGLNLLFFALDTVRMSDTTQLDGKHKNKVVCCAWPSLVLVLCTAHKLATLQSRDHRMRWVKEEETLKLRDRRRMPCDRTDSRFQSPPSS